MQPIIQAPNILTKPIHDLPASALFKEGSAEMGFKTLQDILHTAPAYLRAKEGFNYVWLGELIDLLTGQGILHLLQPTQGNSRV